MGRASKKKRRQKGRGNNKGGGPSHADDKIKEPAGRPRGAGSGGSDGRQYRAVYARYKEATSSFRDGLSKLLPQSAPLASVSDLGNAVEYLLRESERSDRRPPNVGIGLLSCLNASIKLREEITASSGEADEGHAYMNGMLRYCRDVLRRCRKIFVASRGKPESSNAEADVNTGDVTKNTIGDRFAALTVDDDGEEEESEEEGEGDRSPVERPPDPEREYSIEKDLIEGDESTHANWYIVQTNMLMEVVDRQIREHKGRVEMMKQMSSEFPFAQTKNDGLADSAMLLDTMKYSACINLALEEIKYLEEALVAECPQLKTFYHVIATLVFGSHIKLLEGLVRPNVLAAHPHIVLDFIAKEVEHGFRTPACAGFLDNRSRQSQAKFAKMTKVDEDIIANTACFVASATFLEVGADWVVNDEKLQVIVCNCRKFRDCYSKILGGDVSHASKMWEVLGKGTNMIYKAEDGGERSRLFVKGVLRVQSNLQCAVPSMPRSDQLGTCALDPTVRFCDADWDEKHNKAESIDDPRMDDFFHRVFHIPFVNKARWHGTESQEVFDVCFRELLPRFFPLLQGYLGMLKDGDSPVPHSLTLSVHAMLTGVLHLQGDLERIALASKRATDKYFEQVQWVIDQRQHLRGMVGCLQAIKLRQTACLRISGKNLMAFYNPLNAGCFLTQIVYLNNLWDACVLDLDNQLVSILHIFHALKARNILQDDDIWHLSRFDTALDGSKAIWGEGKPTKDFSRSFFLASAISLEASKMMADFVKAMPWKAFSHALEDAEKRKAFEALHSRNFTMEKDIEVARMRLLLRMCGLLKRGSRKAKRLLKPEEMSLSYLCVVNRDFSGLVDDFRRGNSVSAIGRAGTAATLFNYWHRQEALQEKIVEEAAKSMMGVNFAKLSWILNDALNKLATHMNWDGILTKCCNASFMTTSKGLTDEIKRSVLVAFLIGDRILGEIDSEPQLIKCSESKRCADFLKSYFGAIKNEDLSYF